MKDCAAAIVDRPPVIVEVGSPIGTPQHHGVEGEQEPQPAASRLAGPDEGGKLRHDRGIGVGEELVSVGQQIGQPCLGARRDTAGPERMCDIVELLSELLVVARQP
jgi:hypothetical protein